MKKKLFIVNVLLIVFSLMVLASIILMMVHRGGDFLDMPNKFWISTHAKVGLVLGLLVFAHLRLNWNKITVWFTRFKKTPNKMTKALVILSFLAFVSGIVAIPVYIAGGHGPVGDLHGKVALVFLIISITHLFKRIRWYFK
ncbi:MAG: hypothetical protein MJY93_11120 [Fibrobacter sp.]|nr:hypothetical protein [Fibrobacter sp.]